MERVRKDVARPDRRRGWPRVSPKLIRPPPPPDSDIVELLCNGAVREVPRRWSRGPGRGSEGTFAAFFRKGHSAVVWQQECAGVAHQPDEYTEIDYLVNNARGLRLMMLGGL